MWAIQVIYVPFAQVRKQPFTYQTFRELIVHFHQCIYRQLHLRRLLESWQTRYWRQPWLIAFFLCPADRTTRHLLVVLRRHAKRVLDLTMAVRSPTWTTLNEWFDQHKICWPTMHVTSRSSRICSERPPIPVKLTFPGSSIDMLYTNGSTSRGNMRMIVRVVISSATRAPCFSFSLSTVLRHPTTYRGPLVFFTMTGRVIIPLANMRFAHGLSVVEAKGGLHRSSSNCFKTSPITCPTLCRALMSSSDFSYSFSSDRRPRRTLLKEV